jgi:hypothetical protein
MNERRPRTEYDRNWYLLGLAQGVMWTTFAALWIYRWSWWQLVVIPVVAFAVVRVLGPSVFVVADTWRSWRHHRVTR